MKYFLFFISLIFEINLFAQADLKAKYEFELAENDYASGNFNSSLEHLKEAKTLLNKWTPKVSYLEILNLNKLYKNEGYNDKYLNKLVIEVTAYMDYASSYKDKINEEKFFQIYEIEKSIKQEIVYYKYSNNINYKKAVELFENKQTDAAILLLEKCADSNNVVAMDYLSQIYLNNSQLDLIRSFYYDEKAANLNYIKSMLEVGGSYYSGHRVSKNFSKAFEWYKKAADIGSAQAMVYVGIMYNNGEGTSVNSNEYKRYVTMSANLGNSYGMYQLGNIYHYGETPNYSLALEWYSKSVIKEKRGDVYYQLGRMYASGRGVKEDSRQANVYYKNAADLGYIDAYFEVGNFYRINHDYSEALKYLTKAAENGDPFGYYYLGILYTDPDYIYRSKTKAFEYYLKGAQMDKQKNMGVYHCMTEVMFCYYNGDGVKKDKKMGAFWHEKRENYPIK